MASRRVLLPWVLLILVFKQGENCEEDWIENNGNCYRIFTETVNKSVAESNCFDLKSALASLADVQEDTFLMTKLSTANTSEENYWVGLHKIGDELMWNNRASATNLPFVDVSSLEGQSDCFAFNGAKVVPFHCAREANYVCEQWKIPENRPTSCPPGTHRDVLSEKCFWYTHMPLSKVGAEVVCSLKYGRLVVMRGGLFPINVAMILMLSPPPGEINLWTSLAVRNGTFIFEDEEEFSHEDFALRRSDGECVTLMYERGKPYELHQTPCFEEILGLCESSIDFFTQDFSRIFGTRNNDVGPTTAKSCPVGHNWQEHDETGYCYWETSYETSRLSWEDAEEYCRSYGGHLASFHSTTEEKIGLGFQFGSVEHSYWTGLYYDSETDRYIWADGSPLDYTNWDEGQPDHADRRMRCGFMSSVRKKWSLSYCGSLNWFICKAPKQSNPPSPVPPTAEPLMKCKEADDSSEYFFNGYCYEVSTLLYRWHRAQQFCEDKFGDLVSFHEEKEIDFVIRLMASVGKLQGNRIWIGLNSLGLDAAYKWSDGNPLAFTNWDRNEPNNVQYQEKCVSMYIEHGMWNDENCNNMMGFICKRKNGSETETRTTTTPVPVTGYCERDWYIFGDRCFKPFGIQKLERKNWTEAGMHCISQGGYLVSVKDAKYQAFFYYLMQNIKMDTWIGLHDSIHSGIFFWTDNSPLVYTNWARGEPSYFGLKEDCGVMNYENADGGRWKDTACSRELPYICQSPRDPAITSPFPVRGSDCPHLPGYMKQGLSCYKMFSDLSSWDEAQTTCEKDRGHLISIYDIETLAVANYLATFLKDNETYWIGLNYGENYTLQWKNGWPLSFSKWGKNEPKHSRYSREKETCYFSSSSGQWEGAHCSDKKKFICHFTTEKPPRPLKPLRGDCAPQEWLEVGPSCALLNLKEHVEWYTANFRCAGYGARLASIHSMDMLYELQNYFAGSTGSAFIGLSRNSERGFVWADKSPVDFVNWDQGEPENEDLMCVVMMLDTMKWRVMDCDARKPFICGKEKINVIYPELMPVDSSTESLVLPEDVPSGVHPGIVVLIVVCIAVLAIAVAGLLARYRPWEKQMNRYRVAEPEHITSFENAIYSEDPANIDFNDTKVLYAKG